MLFCRTVNLARFLPLFLPNGELSALPAALFCRTVNLGRSRAMHRISLGEHKEPRLVRIFAPFGYFHENLYKKQPAAFQKNTKRKQRAVRSWIFGENARHDSAKDADFSPTYG